jgi:vancomycin resistance protein YoaR
VPLFDRATFRKQIYQLLLAGVFVYASFQLGIYYYFTNDSLKDARFQVHNVQANIASLFNSGLTIEIEDKSIRLSGSEIRDFTEPYIRDYSGANDIRIKYATILEYVKSIAPNVDRAPIDARFQFNGNRAEIFTPSVPGRVLNIDASARNIQTALSSGVTTTQLVINKVEPDITLEKINALGIDTLIGHGESNFSGSSPARIQNIRTSSKRFNGLILKPQEEFSFNTVLGSVEAVDGYAEEKVIKNMKLQYELGGGICQVSTTLFRAAIAAGFPILERRPHAFPVQYYNPQGFDATIYPGVTDFRFVNNSENHIIIQTKIVGTKISFEIYGRDDGREVTVTSPVQYDIQPDGAMKAYFTRKIIYADGTIKDDRFNSTYRSPSLYPLEKNPLE